MEMLAAQGMRFTTAYAQSVCSPTRCGIMTGRTSVRHGVTDWVGARDTTIPTWRRAGLDASDQTLAKQLQEAGYRTIHIGKAHYASSSTSVEQLRFDVNIGGGHWGHHSPTRYASYLPGQKGHTEFRSLDIDMDDAESMVTKCSLQTLLLAFSVFNKYFLLK